MLCLECFDFIDGGIDQVFIGGLVEGLVSTGEKKFCMFDGVDEGVLLLKLFGLSLSF